MVVDIDLDKMFPDAVNWMKKMLMCVSCGNQVNKAGGEEVSAPVAIECSQKRFQQATPDSADEAAVSEVVSMLKEFYSMIFSYW